MVAEGSPLGMGLCQAAGRSPGAPSSLPWVSCLHPWVGSTLGVSGLCPPCPSSGFCPIGRVRGEAVPPPWVPHPFAGTGISHDPLPSTPPPIASGCRAAAPTPPHCPGLLVPHPHVPPHSPRAWAESCPTAQSCSAVLGQRSKGPVPGWGGVRGEQRCQQPPQGVGGWLLPPPCPSCPWRCSAPRSLSGGLRWLPMCQKASPAPSRGLLSLLRPRILRGGVGVGCTHGDTQGGREAPCAPAALPVRAGGVLCALLPVPCSPHQPPALLPWLEGTWGPVGHGWQGWGGGGTVGSLSADGERARGNFGGVKKAVPICAM